MIQECTYWANFYQYPVDFFHILFHDWKVHFIHSVNGETSVFVKPILLRMLTAVSTLIQIIIHGFLLNLHRFQVGVCPSGAPGLIRLAILRVIWIGSGYSNIWACSGGSIEIQTRIIQTPEVYVTGFNTWCTQALGFL